MTTEFLEFSKERGDSVIWLPTLCLLTLVF